MQFPGPGRAVGGLLASAAEEAKHLPDRAIELPMLAVSTALQASLRAQQRYAALTARGDELLAGVTGRGATDEPPPWATFDDPVSTEELRRTTFAQFRENHSDSEAKAMLDALFGAEDEQAAATDAPAVEEPAAEPPAAPATPRTRRPRKSTAKRVSRPRNTAPSAFDRVGDDPEDEPAGGPSGEPE